MTNKLINKVNKWIIDRDKPVQWNSPSVRQNQLNGSLIKRARFCTDFQTIRIRNSFRLTNLSFCEVLLYVYVFDESRVLLNGAFVRRMRSHLVIFVVRSYSEQRLLLVGKWFTSCFGALCVEHSELQNFERSHREREVCIWSPTCFPKGLKRTTELLGC